MRLELLGAAGHQQVDVSALRHRRAVGRLRRQVVALVHRHPVVEVREHRAAHMPAMLAPMTTACSPLRPIGADGTGYAFRRSTFGDRVTKGRPWIAADGLANQVS